MQLCILAKKTGYAEPRPMQTEVIRQYLLGNDAFLCAPTGIGKSLVFEVAPFELGRHRLAKS